MTGGEFRGTVHGVPNITDPSLGRAISVLFMVPRLETVMDPPFGDDPKVYLNMTPREREIMGRVSSIEKVYEPHLDWASLF